MKRQVPIAVLSATNRNQNVAVLSAEIQTTNNGWYQLLPAGQFRARDGRPDDVPYWYIDAEIAYRLIEQVRVSNQDVVIDYDHQTLLRAKKGLGEAIAAGRFNAEEIEWREGEGLFIHPRLTPKAQKHIDDGEYLFLSAVFPYDKLGRPIELRMAALTNDPGVVGMQSLATLAAKIFNTQPQENPMNEKLKELLSKLGVSVNDDDNVLTNELGDAALSALDAIIEDKNKAQENIATLSAKSLDVDLSKYVPKVTYDATVQELAVLSAKTKSDEVNSLVEKACNNGKVLQAEVDYLKSFGNQQGVAALSAMLDSRPQIAALSTLQTQMTKVEKADKNTAILSAADKEAAKLLGMNEKDFATHKTALETK